METEQQFEEDPYRIAQQQLDQAAERLGLDTGMRMAAHMLAIQRVAQATRDRGVYP